MAASQLWYTIFKLGAKKFDKDAPWHFKDEDRLAAAKLNADSIWANCQIMWLSKRGNLRGYNEAIMMFWAGHSTWAIKYPYNMIIK